MTELKPGDIVTFETANGSPQRLRGSYYPKQYVQIVRKYEQSATFWQTPTAFRREAQDQLINSDLWLIRVLDEDVLIQFLVGAATQIKHLTPLQEEDFIMAKLENRRHMYVKENL